MYSDVFVSKYRMSPNEKKRVQTFFFCQLLYYDKNIIQSENNFHLSRDEKIAINVPSTAGAYGLVR